MERLLHYVWQYRLYLPASMKTTDDVPVTVIDPGIRNPDAGPDFFNAKVRIDQTVWAGSIEIHTKASDWFLHNHHKDSIYDAVILHITADADTVVCRSNGEKIPQLILKVPPAVQKNIDWLLYQERAFPCIGFIEQMEPVILSSWQAVLLAERVERKTAYLLTLLKNYQYDWNTVFYIILTRTFGAGINNDAFERLARSLPFRYIQKQRDNLLQVEALLFGQAGMLTDKAENEYYQYLQREYNFLRTKYGLTPLGKQLFRSLRTRPVNFPYVRLAQLAMLFSRCDLLFSQVLKAGTIGQLKTLFRVNPSNYWLDHYNFGQRTKNTAKPVGENMLELVLINTVVPLYFAYAIQHKLPEYRERALFLLENIPPERNSIVKVWKNAGFQVVNAGDSQALIQLQREYCEKKKCLYCRIGFNFLRTK